MDPTQDTGGPKTSGSGSQTLPFIYSIFFDCSFDCSCSQYLADLGRNRYYVIKFVLVEVLSLSLAFAQERTNYSEIV
jgi:hypothetical protein